VYTVVKSYGIAKGANQRWQELNLGAMPVNEIFQLYRKVYLELTAAFLEENIYVDLEVFRLLYINFEGTLSDLLDENGNETIPTIDEIPNLEVKRAYFADAIYSGYEVELSNQSPVGEKSVIDLKISRSRTDMTEVYEHCLFTVNGFFHMSDRDNEFVYINHGGNTMLKSRDNHLGIWSWLNVGKINQVKITDDMLFKQNDESSFSDRVYIKINQDTENKTVLLFAGGYLVRPEPEIFFPVGNDTWCINMGRLPLLRRYFESRQYIDYSFLELDSSTVNDSLISLNQFYSDEKLRKYLTLPQSFIAIIDQPDVYFEEHFVRSSPAPGMLVSYYEPIFPIFVGAGRSPSYWKRHENGQWSITVADSFRQNRMFETAQIGTIDYANDSNQTIRPAFLSKAYLLEAGIDFELEEPQTP
jgi:hypothetical protein